MGGGAAGDTSEINNEVNERLYYAHSHITSNNIFVDMTDMEV